MATGPSVVQALADRRGADVRQLRPYFVMLLALTVGCRLIGWTRATAG